MEYMMINLITNVLWHKLINLIMWHNPDFWATANNFNINDLFSFFVHGEVLEIQAGRQGCDSLDIFRGEIVNIMVEGCRVLNCQSAGQEEDQKEVYSCSERGHEESWCERGGYRRQDRMETIDWLWWPRREKLKAEEECRDWMNCIKWDEQVFDTQLKFFLIQRM